MLKKEGKVLAIVDEIKPYANKDKDGNRLSTTTDHRTTTITMSVLNSEKKPCMLVVHGWDLPATTVLPKEGETWTTPDLRSMNRVQPMVYDARW